VDFESRIKRREAKLPREVLKMEKNLTGLDWKEINRQVSLCTHLISNGAQIPMIIFIKERTLAFNKFEDKFRASFFVDGFLSIGSVGCGIKNRSYEFILRQDLIDRGIISWKRHRMSMGTTRINVWGILKFIMQAIADRIEVGGYEDISVIKRLESIRSVFSKIDTVWSDKRWAKKGIVLPGGKKVKLEDAVQAGKIKGDAAKRRRSSRMSLESVMAFKPTWVLPIMKGFCDDYGQKMNLHWTGKDWGSARNFIDYCLSANEDPRELLRQIVQSWPRFFEGAIMSVKTGRPIRFSKSVDFGQFFQYRTEVLDWLRYGGSGKKREYIKKEIDLRGGK
jgi:hypothetical protein